MSGTIRSRMEAQQRRHYLMTTMSHSYPPGESKTCACSKPWPCPDRIAADDTLTDLNNARIQKAPPAFYKDDGGIRYRLIPDPEGE